MTPKTLKEFPAGTKFSEVHAWLQQFGADQIRQVETATLLHAEIYDEETLSMVLEKLDDAREKMADQIETAMKAVRRELLLRERDDEPA